MTFFDTHTVAEAADLVRAKDLDLNAIQTQRASLGMVTAPDATWDADWSALMTRWGTAKNDVENMSGSLLNVAPNIQSAEPQYQSLLRALQKTEGVTSPGDFQDLADRLAAALKAQNMGGLVEPTQALQPQAEDLDDNAIKTIDKDAKALGLPNPALGFPSPLDFLKKVPWWVWAIAGVVVIGPAAMAILPVIAETRRTVHSAGEAARRKLDTIGGS